MKSTIQKTQKETQMKNVVGQAVTGEDFFERPLEVEKLWSAIEGGSHILLAAPRRVGKTSLLYYLQDNPKSGYHFLYVITQSAYSEGEFYQRLYEAVLESDDTRGWMRKTEKAKTMLGGFFQSIENVGVKGTVDFKIRESGPVNYHEKFTTLLSALRNFDDKLVIMVDEFPETVENIIQRHGEPAAVEFLKRKREIRQNHAWSKNVLFIYTGSIGLTNVVARLNEMDTINDLKDETLLPLSDVDARRFVRELLKEKDFDLENSQIDFLLARLEWLLPFYIQLFIDELGRSYQAHKRKLTNADIETAFDQISNRDNVFKHWEERLRTAFKGDTFKFVIEVLNTISKNGSLDENVIHDFSVRFDCNTERKEVVQSLVHDGYIQPSVGNPKQYRFNSPLLKAWWLYHVAD